MRKIISILLLLLFTSVCFAQKWKNYLDSASLYQSKNLYIDQNYQKATAFYLTAKENLLIDSAGTGYYAVVVSDIANFYKNGGRYTEAKPLYIEAKNIKEKVFGKQHHLYASVCHDLAMLYFNIGKYKKAAPLYLEAKAIREKVLGKEHPDYAASCNDVALFYTGMQQYEKALLLYLEALKIREKVLGKEHPDYAASCNNLATLYTEMKQFDKAEPLYIEAKNIREKVLGKEHPEYVVSLNNLALLYKELAQYDKAELFSREAKMIEAKMGIEKGLNTPKDYANACNTLATLYLKQGLYKKAEPLYLEVIKIREKVFGKAHPEYASALSNLGILYTDIGQYKKAELLYLEAKTIRENVLGKQHEDYSSSLNNLALLYKEMGQFEKAEPLYMEAKNIMEKLYGKEYPGYDGLLTNLANLYERMGEYEKAETLFLKVKSIREYTLGKQHPDYAAALSNLGILYFDLGQYEKAESFFMESMSIKAKVLGTEHPDFVASLNNLAATYEVLKQYKKAEILYLEGKRITEKTLSKEHPVHAGYCDNLAILYSDIGQDEKAESLYLEAKNIREKVLGKEHPEYAKSCRNLGVLYWKTDKYLKSDSLFKEVFNSRYAQVKKMLKFTSEKEKASYIKNIIGTNNVFNSFYYQSFSHSIAAEPFTISILSRNLILSSSQQLRKVIYNSNDIIALGDYEKWGALKKQLAALYIKDKASPDIKELESSADVLEKKLAKVSSAFKKQSEEKTWQDIQRNLNANETAIEFAEFNYYTGKRWADSTYYIALVIRKDNPEPFMVPLFEKKQLDSILLQTGNKTTNDNVKNLYASRSEAIDDTVVLNKSLYKLIWGPLEKELKGVNTVYFAPAGLLHRIAFAALPLNDKEVLSDKYKLVELSTTANIIDQQSDFVTATDKINLYGGIKYNVDTTALKNIALTYNNKKTTTRSLPDDQTRGSNWKDLPGTQKEIDGIKSVAVNESNISVLSGIQATEESIKALDGKNSPVVLHIATHGFFFPDLRQNKKDDLQGSSENGKAFKQSDDPLLRSGLLFAGANTAWTGKAIEGIDDGILTSYEVSNMYLPNTKLVVLSACETGLGDIQGAEGVYGLQRAFKMAGVENLIMSLWKVPDAETAEFMQQLYKNLFAKQSIADAFYNAQTTLKNKYRSDPYKWAAWVMVR